MTPIYDAVQLQTSTRRYREMTRLLDDGEISADAPYQRGHVWGAQRKENLIRSLTMGLPTGGIFLNVRDLMQPMMLIDGKQRLSAIAGWYRGEFAVPADWFPEEFLPAGHAPAVRFPDLTAVGQRLWENRATVAVHETQLTGPDAEQQERALFDLINFGGVAQGDTDL